MQFHNKTCIINPEAKKIVLRRRTMYEDTDR
nr:MAG TPA: hypothetical protein [Caudoviricetes sp.]